jgi:hypothetical protein
MKSQKKSEKKSQKRSSDSISRISRIRIIGFVAGVAMWAALSGCDRNIEPFEPGEEPSPPDLARIFPAESGAGASAGGETPRAAVPPARAEAQAGSGVANSGGSAPISGKIELASEWADAAPEGAILFVIARREGAQGGPPLAVLRIADAKFPLDFEIGPSNVMIPSMQFTGPISLSARLDADGNAMTRGAGDISSPSLSALAPGARDVRLVLSERAP